jgi:thymidylate synthase
MIEAFDCPDASFKALNAIWFQGEHFNVGNGSEEGDTKKLDITIHIKHPENLPLVGDFSPTDMKHVQEYGLTYLYTDFLGEHPYTYGWRLQHPIDQKEELIKAIIKNPNNRQLTMIIRIPEDVSNKEPPCLTMMDFEILDGKVNLTCYFRSWDAYAGLPENIAGIFLYLQAFVLELNERLPEDKQLKTGEMMFHSKNCHIYKRQYKLVEDLFTSRKDTRRMVK